MHDGRGGVQSGSDTGVGRGRSHAQIDRSRGSSYHRNRCACQRERSQERDSGEPAVRFLRTDPLIVAGRNFRSAERVTVTAHIGRTRKTATVAASLDGAFTVRLGRLRGYDPCGAPVTVSARGSRGSTATVRTLPRACAVRQP